MIDVLEERYLLRLRLKPKTILLKEGEMAGQMYFIKSGCIRSYLGITSVSLSRIRNRLKG